MENDIILSPIPLSRLEQMFSDLLDRKLENGFIQKPNIPKNDQDGQSSDKLLNRKGAAKLLGVCLKSVDNWTRKGVITGYRINGMVRYKESELLERLKQIKQFNPAA